MNYIRLTNLTNKYPQSGNYIPQKTGNATLFGIYEETNRIDFKLRDFSEVIPIPNISNRFIIAVTYDKTLTELSDTDGDIVEDVLDVEPTKLNVPPKLDTPIDEFQAQSNGNKKRNRKKKRRLFGRIAAAVAGTTAAVIFAPGLITIGAVAGGIRRGQIRKKKRAALDLKLREGQPDELITPGPSKLPDRLSKLKKRAIGRRNDRRSRIFGLDRNDNITNSKEPKSPLIGDDNKPKPRIFSNLSVSDNDEITTKLFCSQRYYDDLKSAKQSGNPYFINFSFKPEFLIEVNTIPLFEVMDSFLDAELENGVLMKRNNFITDGTINFENLIKYIDWVVAKPSLAEIDSSGVIPANLLCEYEKGDFDKKTGKWSTAPKQDSNTTTETQTTSNTNSSGGTTTNNNDETTPPNNPSSANRDLTPFGVAGTFIGEERRFFNVQINDYTDYIWDGNVWERN